MLVEIEAEVLIEKWTVRIVRIDAAEPERRAVEDRTFVRAPSSGSRLPSLPGSSALMTRIRSRLKARVHARHLVEKPPPRNRGGQGSGRRQGRGEMLEIPSRWIAESLCVEKLWGNGDPLFPATDVRPTDHISQLRPRRNTSPMRNHCRTGLTERGADDRRSNSSAILARNSRAWWQIGREPGPWPSILVAPFA